MELMEHQRAAISRMSNGCVLVGGVGTGKTFTALNYYKEREKPRNVYVITTAKKRDEKDWQHEASYIGLYEDPEQSEVLGCGRLVVDSWNNIVKYKHIRGAFFIFDEQRASGTGVWAKALIEIARHNRWIMVSATPGDDWLQYMAIFIANGFYKNITEFKTKHVKYSYFGGYPKVDKVYGLKRLRENRDSVLVPMEFDRTTERHIEHITVGYDSERFKDVMKTRMNPWTGEPYQNISGLMMGLRRVAGENFEKLTELKKLMEKYPRLIVFYNYDWELEMLRSFEGVRPIFEFNGHKHDPVPEGDEWLYLVNYMAGAEAWNCTTTNTMVMFSETYSYKAMEQSFGRIDRLNTPYKDLYYYILKTSSPIDKAISQALDKKKDFNEKAWLTKQGIEMLPK